MKIGEINPSFGELYGVYNVFSRPSMPHVKAEFPTPYIKSYTEYNGGYSPFSMIPSTWVYVKNQQGNHLPTVDELA